MVPFTSANGYSRHITLPSTLESFFKTLKRELVKGRNYENQEEARQEIFKYIELYYNTKRMHSSLGYRSPVEYERMNAHRILNNCPI